MTDKAQAWKDYLAAARRRLGHTGPGGDDVRSTFQRDFDRIVFSSAFRQLQNKTQVLPFPDHESIRNRLTHSLETSSVGRSLGYLLGRYLEEHYPQVMQATQMDANDTAYMIAAAALAHDIGNPPFGHEGEAAMGAFYRSERAAPYMQQLTGAQRADLENFEGNAAGFRILSHTFDPGSPLRGGLRLSMGTYGAFIKYPYTAEAARRYGLKKFGLFSADWPVFEQVAEALHMTPVRNGDPAVRRRYPLVYLTEAADDICYSLIDFEDGYHLGQITYGEIYDLFDRLIQTGRVPAAYDTYLQQIHDDRQRIGYMRAVAINSLVHQFFEVFTQNEEAILEGRFEGSLKKSLPEGTQKILKEIARLSLDKIYHNPLVLQKEATGKTVLPFLLEKFTAAVFDPEAHKQYFLLLPAPYRREAEAGGPYEKLLAVAMYIASMSDRQAVKWYRRLNGMDWEI